MDNALLILVVGFNFYFQKFSWVLNYSKVINYCPFISGLLEWDMTLACYLQPPVEYIF